MAAEELNAAVAAGRAIRSAGRIERAEISLRHGLIAAIPVAGMLALGTAIGKPVAAVTMAVGAMLVGVAWRLGGDEGSPLPAMVLDGCGLGLATVCGTLSGSVPWLHHVLLALLCLFAGLLSALGRRGSMVGTQSVIAFIVFGRFPESLGPALALGGLVVLGAGAQIVFAVLLTLRPAWREQREAVARAYDRLAELAESPGLSSVATAAALEAAERRLAAPSLLADADVMELANLVQEGRRLRLELGVIAMRDAAGGDGAPDVFATAARILRGIAATARDHGVPAPEVAAEARFDTRTDRLVAALLGQLAAAVRMAQRLNDAAGGRTTRPSRGLRPSLTPLRSGLQRLRANATLSSAAGRHGVRLAVVVTGTALLLEPTLPRGYWGVVAAATVLRPEFGATVTRGVERLGGTLAGVLFATLIAVGLKPNGWAITLIVGLLAWAAFTLFRASFAAGFALLTAMIVFLLHAVAPDSVTIALYRGLDMLVGGAIGLAAYALWPTWTGNSVGRLLSDVVEAQRAYLDRLLAGLVAGEQLTDERLRPLARSARVAYGDASAAIELARTEPARGGGDPARAAAVLGALRRLVYAVHALRIEQWAGKPGEPLPGLQPLSEAFDLALRRIEERLRRDVSGEAIPPLRHLLGETLERLDDDATPPVRAALDELVDAVDTVAAEAGLDVP